MVNTCTCTALIVLNMDAIIRRTSHSADKVTLKGQGVERHGKGTFPNFTLL